jgi:hypothetical protein
MKKPPKSILLAYLVWCTVHILIGISTLLQGGWTVDGDIWPFASVELKDYYDIIEIIIYCGIPILIWFIYSNIVEKHYTEK